MVAHQRGQRLRAQERGVARQHHHVLLFVVVVGQAGEPDRQRVARARLRLLLDELDLHGRRGVLHQRLGDPFRPVPDDDDDPGHVHLGHGVEDVQDHGAATQEMQRLRPLRAHAGALPGGQHHGGKPALFHAAILNASGGSSGGHEVRLLCRGVMPYDEFGLFSENAAEFGLPYPGPPAVRRVEVEVAPGRKVSSLVWGTSAPELVLVHGGAQNAHTWDTVALALDRPLVAIDLPGHGHSDGGPDGSLSVDQQRRGPRHRDRRAGSRRRRRRRHVAGRPLLHRAGRARPRAGPRPGPGRRDARA